MNASHCPLCGGDNDCALAAGAEPTESVCWCVGESFPRELVARAGTRAACICRGCAVAAAARRARAAEAGAPEEG